MKNEKDIYFLKKGKQYEIVDSIINFYKDRLYDISEEYEFPQYSDSPDVIKSDYTDAISYILKNNIEYYLEMGIENDIATRLIVVFPGKDYLIFGMTVKSRHHIEYFDEIFSLILPQYGYTTVEDVPSSILEDFVDCAESSHGVRVVDGKLIKN